MVQHQRQDRVAACAACGKRQNADGAFCVKCGRSMPIHRAGQESADLGVVGTHAAMRKRALIIGAIVACALVVAAGFVGLRRDDGASDLPSSTDDISDSTPSPQPTVQSPVNTSVGADPLNLGVPFENLACTDDYIVLLATSGDDGEYASKLGAALRAAPDAKYLEAASSCSAFLTRDGSTGDLIYNAYTGPFASLSDACSALDSLSSETVWVRKVGRNSKERETCMCLSSASSLPVVSSGFDTGVLSNRRLVAQVQWIFYKIRLNDRESIYGNYSPAFADQVRAWQADMGLTADGVVDSATWGALQTAYCGDNDALLGHG